jgi:acylphosphatase
MGHTVRYRVTVSGRVQGVWYRESCRREAIARNVTGWIRNNHDGTVEAALEGQDRDVEQVLDWMRSGPPRAVVTDIEVRDEPPRCEHGFIVR